ncbi:MAG TPA: alpha-amylase family glycosyl hydrolase [Verrucomicrobiae bacterium]|nr:alpha-amylase family glycosyl hydrolase [Verrucomicrobiae bacterium]
MSDDKKVDDRPEIVMNFAMIFSPANKRHFYAAIGMLVFCLLSVAGVNAQSPGNEFWQRQNIYQLLTDRFFNGDPSNDNVDGNYDPAGHGGTSVHGGDFKGVEQKLDYIKSLGATAIWISPVVLNVRGEFHGYDARDFYKVDPHWGTMADLQHLVKAAHARGILVIDDIVVNHGGNLIDSADPGYPAFKYPPDGYHMRFHNPAKQYAPPFDLNATNPAITNLFHNNGFIQDYEDTNQLELGELSSLDDLRTETPYVREQMKKIYEFWIEQAGFDGFRIDTVKHVEMGFWEEWCPAIREFAATHGKTNFFMFGEVPHQSDVKCGSYTGTMGSTNGPFKLDSVLDYTLYFKVDSLFAAATSSTRQIAEHYRAVATDYDQAAQGQLVTFLDNHDQPRFLSLKGATVDRLKVALIFLYTTRGIPCLYAGTEQAFDGAKDPWDREDMFAGQFEWGPSLGDNFNMTHPLYQLTAKLNNFRRLYPALETGVQSNLWNNQQGPGMFAYTRQLGTQSVFVVFNTATTNRTLPACPIAYPAGTKLVNVLNESETIFVRAGGKTPPVVMPGTSAKIFVAATEVQPLNPVVTGISPVHDAKDILPTAPVVIRFSKPMDTASVEQAFSVIPVMNGTFAWSQAHDEMTFTPGRGFAPRSLVAVRISDTARAAGSDGQSFYAGFEARYTCGGAVPVP